MRYEVSRDIDAPVERVWSVLTDVERMPEWTSSMTSVQLLDRDKLGIGSAVRIKQPRLPAAIWRVSELTPMRSFSWTSKRGGVTTVGEHVLSARGGIGTAVTFTIEQRGFLAPLIAAFTSRLTRSYVNAEMPGLTLRSETAT